MDRNIMHVYHCASGMGLSDRGQVKPEPPCFLLIDRLQLMLPEVASARRL